MIDSYNYSDFNRSYGLTESGSIENGSMYYYNSFNYPPLPDSFKAYLEMEKFKKWAVPLIFTFGFPLNIVTFYIYSSTTLKYVSSSIYMAAIALVDTGVLLTHFLAFLSRSYEVHVYHIYGACQIIMYINFMCVFLSIWYLTSLVTEKFIGINWPKRKSIYCTVFRAKCVISALAILSIVCYHYLTWTVGPDSTKSHCFPFKELGLLVAYQTLDKMDFVLVSSIPYVMIFILSCLISFQTWRFYKSKSIQDRVIQSRRQNGSFAAREKEYKTTPVVLSLCFLTFSLGIVHSVCRIFRIQNPILFSVASFLSFNSYAVKIFVHIGTCKAFRFQLVELLRGIAHRIIQRIPWIRLIRSQSSPEMHSVDQQTDGTGAIEVVMEGTV